ncbi:MAG TPA: HAD family hydrolase [Isosphaeraceae bacterium]|jgi:HAD superfamily hydrolase (TIGR01509 family)|nr:HAD family hydrolase [Isosphaeraceae bacterium]
MIDWVFLDVGNILLDEDPLTYLVFRRHVEAVQRVRPDRSFADLLAEREARASAGSAWPVYETVSAYLDSDACADVWATVEREVEERYAELSPLIPGAAELVDWLAARFGLGLIANQGRACRERLADLGLLARFEVVAFSEEESIAKPDPGLFQRAIERAGAEPSRCLMVGDRLDNDLEPAARLGMATAWVLWPRREAKGWQPGDPEAMAYVRSLDRSARCREDLWRRVQPTVTVAELNELAEALALRTGEGLLSPLDRADQAPYHESPRSVPDLMQPDPRRNRTARQGDRG